LPGGRDDHRRRLAPTNLRQPLEAGPIVERIFREYVSGRGIYAIAEGLTCDGIPSPSGHDPERNKHRQSSRGAWGKSAVRVILGNPRYTGRQVWNRQRRDEELVDVDDVALGHQTKLRWNDQTAWVWSAEQAHEPLVSPELFQQAQEQRAIAGHRTAVVRPKRKNTYILSGRIKCGMCGRRMQGNPNHGTPHYRCRFPSEYALAAEIDHPKTVYVREAAIVADLDRFARHAVR
jgi:site-specific DNA recombinase